MNETKNNNLNVFITGAIFGALATFLFATKTGRKIKDEILEEGGRLFDALSNEIEEAPSQIKDAKKEIKKELSQKADQIEEMKEQVADTSQDILREVPEQVEEIQKKGRHFFFKKRSGKES